jgi:molecular chaperone GrpE
MNPLNPIDEEPLRPPGGEPGEDDRARPGLEAGDEVEELGENEAEDEGAGEDGEEAAELADWKSRLRDRFEAWLEDIDQIPALEAGENAAPPEPDLYAFHEALAALNAECRRANRRTAETLSQWGGALDQFRQDLGQLRQQAAPPPAEPRGLPRNYCLTLVEIRDRLERLARAFGQPPKKSWWSDNDPWEKAWGSQRQAFGIVLSHFNELLLKEGVTPFDTQGKAFDPAIMTAVAAETNPSQPHQTVLEVLAAGYLRHGELLRPAQVKIALNPSQPPSPQKP